MLNLLQKALVVSALCVLDIALPTTSAAAAAEPTGPVSMTMSQAPNRATVTDIKVNGQFAELLLVDTDGIATNGVLTASKDIVANTSALDFSYAYVDPTNQDQVILIVGAGEIPNTALTITATIAHTSTAHLAVTVTSSTAFMLNRCVINLATGLFECAPPASKSFDLTWTTNGLGNRIRKHHTGRDPRPGYDQVQGCIYEQDDKCQWNLGRT